VQRADRRLSRAVAPVLGGLRASVVVDRVVVEEEQLLDGGAGREDDQSATLEWPQPTLLRYSSSL
jgi:hypothetical protein